MTFEEQVLQVELAGYTLLPGLLTREECGEARRELERIFAEEAELPGAPCGRYGQQAYNLMNKARVLERVYQLPPLLRLLRHFLGEDCVLSSVQAHLVLPGAPAQSLHRDGSQTGPFRPPAPADGDRALVSHALGFNVVFCVGDFTRENGATRLVPGSHRFPTRGIPREGPVPGETIIEHDRTAVPVRTIDTSPGCVKKKHTPLLC